MHLSVRGVSKKEWDWCYKNILLRTELQISIVPFNVVPLGSHTLPETLLPLPVAVLEVFMWKCHQLVYHDPLDVVHSFKMTTFEVEFEFREKQEVARTQIRRGWGLRNRWNNLFGQTFVHGHGSVTGSAVMQHPSVRSLWSDTMKPFPESFKGLTIVLLINCLSLRHEFLVNDTLTVGKTN